MTPSLTVTVATLARPTLARALASIRSQGLLPGDEVLVVGDGHRPAAEAAFAASGLPGRYLVGPATPAGPAAGGGSQRDFALPSARGTHLLWMDDDDVYTPHALAAVRAAAAEHPSRPLFFRMYHTRTRELIWRHHRPELGNVGTICICFPNDPARLGRWGRKRACDWEFVASSLPRFPEPVWREEVIACVRPAAAVF